MKSTTDIRRLPRGRPLGRRPSWVILTLWCLVLADLAPHRGGRNAPRSGQRPVLLPRAIQVRFEGSTLRTLERLEAQAKALGRKGFTRSSMIREAVRAYVEPLVALLDRKGELDRSTQTRLTDPPDGGQDFGETTRVRLGSDLVELLDRVEAYARGLGYRHVTRSSLIRDGVHAYLTAFRSELQRDDKAPDRFHEGVALTRK